MHTHRVCACTWSAFQSVHACIYLNQCWECKRPQQKWAGHQSPGSRRQGLVICGSALFLYTPPPTPQNSASPASNWPGSTAGHAVLHGLDEVIISRPLTTSKIYSFWNGHNGGLTRRDISIISSSPPLSSLSPLGTGRVWFIPGLMRGGDLWAWGLWPTSAVLQDCSHNCTVETVEAPEDERFNVCLSFDQVKYHLFNSAMYHFVDILCETWMV